MLLSSVLCAIACGVESESVEFDDDAVTLLQTKIVQGHSHTIDENNMKKTAADCPTVGICVSSAACGSQDATGVVGIDCNGKMDCAVTVTEANSGGGSGIDLGLGVWEQKDGYWVKEQHFTGSGECYATLEEAQAVCMKAGDCHAVATQNNFCNGQFRVTHGGPTLLYQGDNWPQYALRSWFWTSYTRHDKTLGNAKSLLTDASWPVNGKSPGECDKAFPDADCIKKAEGFCDNTPNCVSFGFSPMWYGGVYPQLFTDGLCTSVSNEEWATTTQTEQTWTFFTRDNDPKCCKDDYAIEYTCDGGTDKFTAALTKPSVGKIATLKCEVVATTATTTTTTTAAPSTTPGGGSTFTTTTIPGGETNIGGADCFGAIATFGPDFECNFKVSSFCSHDSADGLDVSACCQDYCNSNREKTTKQKVSEREAKAAEGVRKSDRQESSSKRKGAEALRKKNRMEAEWLQKRGVQETTNKKAEDERKTKRGYSESKTKNERSWKANRQTARKNAQLREAARKSERARKGRNNDKGEGKRKERSGKKEESRTKKKEALTKNTEKRKKINSKPTMKR